MFTLSTRARLAVAATLTAAALPLAGCSQSPSAATSGTSTVKEMDFQYEGQSSKDMQAAINVCSSDQVKIDRQAVPFQQFVQKVLLSASSKDLPDVMYVDYSSLPQIAKAGILAPLDEVGVDYSRVQKNTLELGNYNGKQYGVAPGVNTLALFYNKKLFTEAGLQPPTNWDELKSTAAKLTTGNRYGLALSANAGEESVFQFEPFLWSNGGEVTNLDSPQAVEALKYVTGLVQDGSVSKSAVSWSQADVNDQFMSGKAAMQINGSWQIPVLKGQQGVDWGSVPIPAPTGKTSVTPFGGENWVVTASGAKNPAAGKFVQCMIDTEAMNTWATAHSYVPTNAEQATKYAQETPDMATFVTAVKTAKSKLQGIPDGYETASSKLSTAIQAALTGGASPEQALATAAK